MKFLPFTVVYFHRMMKARQIRLLPAIAVGLTASAIGLLIPWISKFFIDEVLVNRNIEYTYPCLLLWLFLEVLRFGGNGLRSLSSTVAASGLTVGVGVLILEKIHNCSRRIFHFYDIGEFVTRMHDVESGGSTLLDVVNEITEIVVYLTVLPLIFLIIDPSLAFIVGATVVLCVVSSAILSRIIERLHKRKRSEEACYVREFLSTAEHIAEFQNCGIRQKVFDEIQTRSFRINELEFQKSVTSNAHRVANRMLFSIGSFFYRLFSVALVAKGRMTIGDFFAYNTVLSLLFSPIEALTSLVRPVQEMIVNSRRVEDLLLFPEQMGGKALLPALGGIMLNKVSMRYGAGGVYALRNVDFHFKQGVFYGLVGPNGSGKSTLLRLIARQYDPDDGEITYGGRDIGDIDRDRYQSEVSYVPAVGYTFPTSFERNIVLEKEFRQERFDRIVEGFGIGPLREKFSATGATLLGGEEVRLSSGEVQRLTLARAVYHDHRIYLLDEALSALDAVSLDRAMPVLRRQIRNKVVIVVSHHLDALKSMDCIVCLSGGRLVETGSYEELCQPGTFFFELFHGRERG